MRFNVKGVAPSDGATTTTNSAGGSAFVADPFLHLYLMAVSGFLSDTAAMGGSQHLAEIQRLVKLVEPREALALAEYARTQMHLRTLPLVILAEVAGGQPGKAKPGVREACARIIQRADEPAELLSYYTKRFHAREGTRRVKGAFPNSLRKGIIDALKKFDEYQLAKYDSAKEFKLRDVLRVTHALADAKHLGDQERVDLYHRAIIGDLATPETWETSISAKGSTAESWDAIAPKMGIMALLRNLRNFIEKGATGAIDVAVRKFQDPEAVQRSKQLPFRWFSALKVIHPLNHAELNMALGRALEMSVANIPKFAGRTAIFCDNSGSMHSPISAKSAVTMIEISAILGALADHLSEGESLVGAFGQTYEDVSLDSGSRVMANMAKILRTDVGHSTNAHLSLDSITRRRMVFDRVFVFSDMQCYSTIGNVGYSSGSLNEAWKRYREVAPNATLWSVDLSGDGTLQWPQNAERVVHMGGWSERIFDLVHGFENALDTTNSLKAGSS